MEGISETAVEEFGFFQKILFHNFKLDSSIQSLFTNGVYPLKKRFMQIIVFSSIFLMALNLILETLVYVVIVIVREQH